MVLQKRVRCGRKEAGERREAGGRRNRLIAFFCLAVQCNGRHNGKDVS